MLVLHLLFPFSQSRTQEMVGLPSLVLPSSLKPFLKHPKMCLNSDKVDNEDKSLLEHLRLGSFIVDIPMSRRFSI